jgi:hypothetical protein
MLNVDMYIKAISGSTSTTGRVVINFSSAVTYNFGLLLAPDTNVEIFSKNDTTIKVDTSIGTATTSAGPSACVAIGVPYTGAVPPKYLGNSFQGQLYIHDINFEEYGTGYACGVFSNSFGESSNVDIQNCNFSITCDVGGVGLFSGISRQYGVTANGPMLGNFYSNDNNFSLSTQGTGISTENVLSCGISFAETTSFYDNSMITISGSGDSAVAIALGNNNNNIDPTSCTLKDSDLIKIEGEYLLSGSMEILGVGLTDISSNFTNAIDIGCNILIQGNYNGY